MFAVFPSCLFGQPGSLIIHQACSLMLIRPTGPSIVRHLLSLMIVGHLKLPHAYSPSGGLMLIRHLGGLMLIRPTGVRDCSPIVPNDCSPMGLTIVRHRLFANGPYDCSPPIVRQWALRLFATDCSPMGLTIVRHRLFATDCSPPIIRHRLFATDYSPPIIRHKLLEFTYYRLMEVVCLKNTRLGGAHRLPHRPLCSNLQEKLGVTHLPQE